MTVEKAIETAIDYEIKIRDLYRDAADQAPDPVGRRIFSALGDDEDSHVTYLENQLRQLRAAGQLDPALPESALPDQKAIEKSTEKLQRQLSREDRKSEKQMLSKALAVEKETSAFYRRMAAQLSEAGRRMFTRFQKIEDGHIGLVQAELDYLTHTGYWLDFKEFDME